MNSQALSRLEEVNKELWLLLSIFLIAALLNFVIASDQMILSLYFITTVASAYIYGRRHGTLIAFGSVLILGLVAYFNSALLTAQKLNPWGERWFDVAAWAGILIVTGYLMGSLYERKEAHSRELRESYHGILLILRQFISNDKYTQSHSCRVSIYSAKIGAIVGLDSERIEDIRAASMLDDIGMLGISRPVLHEAARLTPEDLSI